MLLVTITGEASFITTAKYIKKQHNWTIKLTTAYSTQYDGGGKTALIDGIHGDVNWRKGNWQGYQNVDVEVIINLQKPTAISNIAFIFCKM